MIHSIVYTILKDLGGIAQYGVVSLCLFCLVFAGVLLCALLQTKGHVEYMAQAALEESDKEPPGPVPATTHRTN